MNQSKRSNYSRNHGKKRRALVIALFGAGAPLAHRSIPGEWTAPVVDTVILPAHAQTSPRGGSDPDDDEVLPLGDFGSTITGDAGSSLFENIAERTEEEILNLFIRTAEAATCPGGSCSADGEASVEVAATINADPTDSACIEAKVTLPLASCDTTCARFQFTASVDGSTVTVTDGGGCDLQLTDIVRSASGLNGNWSFNRVSFSDSGTFSAAAGGGGCGSLSCV